MTDLRGLFPDGQLRRGFVVGVKKFNRRLLRLVGAATLGQEYHAVIGAAKVTDQRKSAVDNLAFPFSPGIGHRYPRKPSPSKLP